jgi:PIN domain nuclease of toxin-antitoxin system
LTYLVDTHIALWAIYQSRRLSARARELLSAEGVEAYVSVASLWEIALKNTMRPGELPPVRQAMADFTKAGLRELAVTGQAMIALEGLPVLHKDPFDRMLISQALTEGLVLMTGDKKVGAYDPDQRYIQIV